MTGPSRIAGAGAAWPCVETARRWRPSDRATRPHSRLRPHRAPPTIGALPGRPSPGTRQPQLSASMSDLAKSFEPAAIEARWAPLWEQSGVYEPTLDPARESFSIQLPPPNVTGTLHMGHAFQQTLM